MQPVRFSRRRLRYKPLCRTWATSGAEASKMVDVVCPPVHLDLDLCSPLGCMTWQNPQNKKYATHYSRAYLSSQIVADSAWKKVTRPAAKERKIRKEEQVVEDCV